MIGGTTPRSAPIITAPLGGAKYDIIPYKPSVTGRISGDETIINGRRKLFQVATKMNRKMVTIAGASSRRTIVKKILASEAPSIRAASISSVGTEVSA